MGLQDIESSGLTCFQLELHHCLPLRNSTVFSFEFDQVFWLLSWLSNKSWFYAYDNPTILCYMVIII